MRIAFGFLCVLVCASARGQVEPPVFTPEPSHRDPFTFSLPPDPATSDQQGEDGKHAVDHPSPHQLQPAAPPLGPGAGLTVERLEETLETARRMLLDDQLDAAEDLLGKTIERLKAAPERSREVNAVFQRMIYQQAEIRGPLRRKQAIREFQELKLRLEGILIHRDVKQALINGRTVPAGQLVAESASGHAANLVDVLSRKAILRYRTLTVTLSLDADPVYH